MRLTIIEVKNSLNPGTFSERDALSFFRFSGTPPMSKPMALKPSASSYAEISAPCAGPISTANI